MASDILFGKSRMWSTQTIWFKDMIDRARQRCGNNIHIEKELLFAKEVGCLSLKSHEDRHISVRYKLIQCILAAAMDVIEELQAERDIDLEAVRSVQELVELSRIELIDIETG